MWQLPFLVTRRGFDNIVVPTSVCTGGRGCPLDTRIEMGSNPLWENKKGKATTDVEALPLCRLIALDAITSHCFSLY